MHIEYASNKMLQLWYYIIKHAATANPEWRSIEMFVKIFSQKNLEISQQAVSINLLFFHCKCKRDMSKKSDQQVAAGEPPAAAARVRKERARWNGALSLAACAATD